MAFKLSPVQITLTLAFVALNLTIGGIVSWLKLPIYLDSLGIVLATILLGWPFGILCALLTVSIGFFFVNPYLPFYVATSLAIVFTVEVLRRRNMYSTFLRSIASGIILGVMSAVVSAPVTAFLFGGVTASGADLLTALFARTGKSLVEAVFWSGISSEPVDKTIVCVLAFITLKGLPSKFLQTFRLRGGERT